MLLQHIGQPAAAANVRRAVAETINDGGMTPDLGGLSTTVEVTAAVCAHL